MIGEQLAVLFGNAIDRIFNGLVQRLNASLERIIIFLVLISIGRVTLG